PSGLFVVGGRLPSRAALALGPAAASADPQAARASGPGGAGGHGLRGSNREGIPMHETTIRSGDLPAEYETLPARFEAAWECPAPPDLDEFVSPAGLVPTRLLTELIHIDLDFRLRRGDPVRVESYVERYPHLGHDHAALRDLIAAEFALRHGLGD